MGGNPWVAAGFAVLAVAGVAAGPLIRQTFIGRICNWTSRSAKESPEQAVPVESVESIFRVLANERNRVANDRLYDALDELDNVYSPDEIDAKLNEAVAEWSRNRPSGAGNPPGRADMIKVLRSIVQEFHESRYRAVFSQHFRELVSLELDNSGYISQINDVFVQLQAERSTDGENRRRNVEEADNAEERWDESEFLDFRGKGPGEIENMLQSAGNIGILGGPGSGKSTLLRYLAATCAESEADDALLPVFLRLRDYASGSEALIAKSAATFSTDVLQLEMPQRFFEDALRSGRCLVCLDALDEVPEEERKATVRRVRQLAHNSNSHFIITSRLAGYDENPLAEQIFTRYVVQPMDDDGISAFIDRQFADEPERTQNLKDLLTANPGIKSLVSNPLLMTILKLVYRKGDAGLPLNRAEFYERAVDILVRDEDDEGRRIDDVDLKVHQKTLTDIARFLHDENRETISRTELEDQTEERLLKYHRKSENPTEADEDEAYAEAQAFIERAEQRTGLLVEEHPGSGVFRFVHATFREYLTAKDIHLRHRNYGRHHEECWEEIKDHLTDARWREVILLLVGSLDHRYCTYLTEKILAAGDEFIHQPDEWELPTHLLLAAEALANQAPMSSELQQKIVGRLGRVAMGRMARSLAGNPDSPQAVVFLTSIIDVSEYCNVLRALSCHSRLEYVCFA